MDGLIDILRMIVANVLGGFVYDRLKKSDKDEDDDED